tara:strand:- start:7676 stop:8071 length:396 start_codon:yes stop_codon:yes gene_type:complete
MNHQDWNTVNIGRSSGAKLTQQEISLKQRQQIRAGNSTSHLKQFHNCNSSNSATPNAKKLADATESEKIQKLNCGKEIMQAMNAKNMKLKDLAQALNKKKEEISDFVNNKALATPKNKQLLNLIKRKLSIK